ncbi:MAG TPA: DUF3047 domain-containing protein [Burkholderiales bacterium]|nr:DUF3047 domain-containing protein [Burkholderiales bacterium]
MNPLRMLVPAAAVALAAACTTGPLAPTGGAPSRLAVFSTLKPGEPVPPEWNTWTMSQFKTHSQYQLVEDGGVTVLKGRAVVDSASGLLHDLDLDLRDWPILSWRWKVMDLAPSESSPDDSPVRVLVNFAGDLGKLPFSDRVFYDQFRFFSGQRLPYAGVMYVWGSKTPKGGEVRNKYTSRIKMIAVESGRAKLGQWLPESRNVEEDYRRLFGEEPGKVVSVGIMTEADGSDRPLEAYYGDIAFRPPGECCGTRAMGDN